MTAGFNKAFESKVRLGIMSLLVLHSRLDFNSLKEMLDVTDGNLASHAAALEKLGYINVRKEFKGKKTSTTYQVSRSGKKAFMEHLNALETIIRNTNG